MGELIPQFGGLLWTALAFVTALSVIVAVHEYGHYIVGRWCGIQADVFSIGFGPRLFARRDRRGTLWQVAALPLGGYVKFRGDANPASVGADDALLGMSSEERGATMMGAALWKRAATVIAGPLANFILSILVFGAFVLVEGRPATAPVVGPVVALPPGTAFLEPGDEVVSVDGVPVATLTDLSEIGGGVSGMETVPYVVRRDGAMVEVDAAPPMPARAASVQPRSAAWDVGLRPDDVILSIDGASAASFADLREATAMSDGRPLTLEVWRPSEDDVFSVTLVPRRTDLPAPGGTFETRYLIGLSGGLAFEPATEPTGPLAALAFAVRQTGFIVQSSLSALWHIATAQISTCNLSGPIGIAETSGAVATMGAGNFIWFIAVLSTAIGLLNLFPIPVLDGGHLVFHGYEAVRGRPPSDRAVRVLMTVGIAMMAALMLFAVFNDLFCP